MPDRIKEDSSSFVSLGVDLTRPKRDKTQCLGGVITPLRLIHCGF